MKSTRLLTLSLMLVCITTLATAQCRKLVFFDTVPNLVRNGSDLWQPGNPDSVYVDTASASPTYGKRFTSKWYHVLFQYNILPLSLDTSVYPIEGEWQDIDTNYKSIRSSFQEIESKWGHFVFRRETPYVLDTGIVASHSFLVRFDSVQPEDSVLAAIRSTDGVLYAYVDNGLRRIVAVLSQDAGLLPGSKGSQIYEDGSPETFFPKDYHTRGYQWALWSMKCPMAWEITSGTAAIFLADMEGSWGPSDVDFGGSWTAVGSSHPDMTNFKQVLGANSDLGFDSRPLGYRMGLRPPDQQHNDDWWDLDEHGLLCMSAAIAANDNGHAMVGSAPHCSGVATSDRQLRLIDVDGKNGVWQTPHVIFDVGGGSSSSFEARMLTALGSVYINAGGNNIAADKDKNRFGVAVNDPAYSHPLWYPNLSFGPQGGVEQIGETPDQDIPSINVGPYGDGQLNCTRFRGMETFVGGWNFSCGVDKFNTSTGWDNDWGEESRMVQKDHAWMDVVAPAWSMMVSVDGPGTHGDKWGPRKYDLNISGTSLAAPLVAGVVGLMRSINTNLGSTGTGIQKSAHTLLTFTADKVIDDGNGPTELRDENNDVIGFYAQGWPSDRSNVAYADGILLWNPALAGKPWQYDYVQQANDPLHRSWAQRMGFGKVNAYRAVAHAIPLKGSYSYASSQTLDFGTATKNENGERLMHFGAWKNATDKVLEHGGNIIPNQTPAWPHYNQGQTLLYSSGGAGTVLTVGDSPSSGDKDILAIDGNVIGDGVALNKIISTSNGKVLLTGYLQDVEVVGSKTKTDDLIIYSGSSEYGRIEVDAGQVAEVYGVVKLQNYGRFVVNGGTLTVQPGGEIHMDGNKDFEILPGSSVTMEASSRVVSSSKEIIVDNGATLTISGLLPVEILATLRVKPGGNVVVNDAAELHVDKFIVESDGHFTCHAGGRVVLNKNTFSYCYGHLLFDGTSTKRATLTAGVSKCGLVYQTAGIKVQGSLTSLTEALKTDVDVHYTDDSDVEIIVQDAIKQPFDNDHFSINSSFNGTATNPLGLSTMLRAYNTTIAPPIISTLLKTLTVTHCQFFDEWAADVKGQIPATWHNADGISAENVQFVDVENNNFFNGRLGAKTLNCGNVHYISNVFGVYPDGTTRSTMRGGTQDVGSSPMYCSNSVANCYDGGFGVFQGPLATLFDNSFATDTTYGFTSQGGTVSYLRNNTFSDYHDYSTFPQYAAWVAGTGSVIRMTDLGSLEYGRNHFNQTPKTGVWGFVYDLVRGGKYSPGGDLIVKCGLNYLGKYSQFQAVNLNSPSYPLDGSYNNWDPSPSVALVTLSGTSLNTSATTTSGCIQRTDVDPPACTPPSSTRQRSEAWYVLPSTSTTLKTAFSTALATVTNTSSPVDERREAAMDALWAAMLVDSSSEYLATTLSSFNSVAWNATEPAEFRSRIWMLKAQIHEMTGQLDSAYAVYSLVAANYHQYSDSVYAQWGLNRLSIAHDTVTAQSDSLTSVYTVRTISDVLANMDTVARVIFKPAENPTSMAGIEFKATPEGAQHIRLDYSLPAAMAVKVEMYDILGSLLITLIDKQDVEGWHHEISQIGQVPSGSYVLRLSTGNAVLSRHIVLMH